ncbi:MAG: hypothetical protein OXC15_05325, partial [Rhodospirillaceae bacterium]|nr:hypothetical protein [Rhodospirillaceae bacterium]
MKKSKVTRSLMAACSIVALSAVMYGCVHSGDSAPPEVEAPDLTPAQMAAKSAADAAEAASDAAAAAVAGAAASSSADPASYVEARDAAAAARAAARAAAAANADAAAATTLEDAAAAQRAAEAAQAEAEDARDDAVMYADMVTAAQADLDQAEADRLAAEAQAEADRLAEIEDARQAIADAETEAEAQAAADAVDDVASVDEAAELQRAVEARKVALATMARAEAQKMALTTAAGNVDTSDLMTADAIAAANMAIAALQMALDEAVDVSDADKAMYQGQLDAAEMAVATAQNTLDRTNQMTALDEAVEALQMLDLSNLSTKEAIGAAEDAIAGLRTALDNATELTDAEKTAAMTELAAASRNVMVAKERVDTNSQMTMLADAVAALGMIDLDDLMTQAQIDAANKAIIELDMALEAATNLTDAQKLDALTDVTLAKRKVASAETVLAENVGNQRMALTEAGTALAAIDLDDLDTAEKIAAANEAVETLKMALANATHLSDAAKMMYQTQLDTATETVRTAQTGMDRDGRMMAQRTAITDAVTAIGTAVGAVNDTATDDEVMTADNAVAALKKAIDDAADLGEGDPDVVAARATLKALEGQLESAKTSRTAAMEKAEEERRMAEAEEERKQNEANAATAAKLHAGISEPSGDPASPAATTDRAAAYDADGNILVSIGLPADAPAAVELMEDKKTTVADNHGWTGQKFTAEPDGDGTYEAVVYSKVGEPTEGAKFNAGPDAGGYTLDADGELVIDTTSDADIQMRVASSQFDQSAGVKTFKLPENTERVMIPGSYHGVSGTYYCEAAGTTICASRLSADGYQLGTVASADDSTFSAGATGWNFKPTNPEARVMSTPDSNYASYGWWLHMSENGMAYTASAFADDRGTVDEAAGITALRGSATYMGGAAGKYALSSSTGGTNDAGHFTARATLEADFNEDMISG